MSGLACCFHRDGAPAGAEDLARVAAALDWRGPDGRAEKRAGPFALAVWRSFGAGEIAADAEAGLVAAFDGRLDNREELRRALPEAPAALSDAFLFLAAWRAWGEAGLARLLGPFAAVVAEPAERRVFLARDPVGHRGLAFHLSPRLLLAASDENAIAADPRVGRELDPAMVALYVSLEDRVDGRTFFRGIRQVLPGECWRIDAEGAASRPFYRPPLETPMRRREEWQEELRRTLRAAVACRLPGAGEAAGILLSGGLDSTPLAGLAREARPGGRVASFTWAFARHPECDERELARETAARFALEAHEVGCDDAGPLASLPPAARLEQIAADASWPLHPGTPEQNAYRLFHQRSYAAARGAGVRVLLSGMGGDQLYSGAESFVAELWRERRFAALLAELGWHLGHRCLSAAAFRDLLPAEWIWARRRRRRAKSAPWLTPAALALLPQGPPWPLWAGEAMRPEQVLRIFEPTNAHGINVECYYALRLGVSARYPWRDRRILELALLLPAIELRDRNVKRPIVRSALRQMMPQNVIDRRSKTSFEPVFRRSLFDERRALQDLLLDRSGASWPSFVARSFLDRERLRVPDARGALMIWICLALELWLLREKVAGAPIPPV